MEKIKYKTSQENFWAEEFGDEYISRNVGQELLASNLKFFSEALKKAGDICSFIEFGANVGMNLKALNLLYPKLEMSAIEINKKAVNTLEKIINKKNIFHGSILDFNTSEKFDLVLIKTVLIHINPDKLRDVYKNLYSSSRRFILICEYYNTTPVEIEYRGHKDKLFKRDFAGEMLEIFPDLSIADYGFSYHRIPPFLNDDITWFLLEKK
jgi:spore coat polysaccharide biosynthesis protein SpsF